MATRISHNVVKAAWNIFGKSYEYRAKYNAYKAGRMAAERAEKKAKSRGSTVIIDGQQYLAADTGSGVT